MGTGIAGFALAVAMCVALESSSLTAQAPAEAVASPRPRDHVESDAPSDPTLWIPRALFAGPRLAFDVATLPLVGIAALEDEYQVIDRAEEIFFNDDRTFGVFPTAFVETGNSPNVGVRILHRDVAGRGERLRLRAGYGGVHRQVYAADLGTRPSTDQTRLAFGLGHRIEDRGRFYGIGNADVEPVVSRSPRHDPLTSVIEVPYLIAESWMEASGTVRPMPTLAVTLSERWRHRELDGTYSEPDESALVDVYDTSSLAGVGIDRIDLVVELEVEFDTRKSVRADMPDDQPATGWLLSGAVARQVRSELLRSDFGRLRLDLNRYVDLYRGDRLLRLRLYGVWVAGAPERIPFPDLATLGGRELLRGYPAGRFRDRISGLGSVEYRYPVTEGISGYLFADAGRVYHDIGTLSLASLRVGLGGGLRIYSADHTWLRLQFASSIDGGLFFHLELNPDDDA